MSDHPRFTLNRSLVILVPQQPFFEWIMAVDTDPVATLTLEHVREDQSVFLVPDDVATSPEALLWVEQRWRAFFEFMLGEWFDESLWPETLTLLYDDQKAAERETEGLIDEVIYLGDMTYYDVYLGGTDVEVRLSMRNVPGRPVLEVGTKVRVAWSPSALILFR